MPGRRDTWDKPIPRQNIVIIRRADRTPLSRRQRAELSELNAEVSMPPDEANLWTTEYKLARKIGQDSTATKLQGGRKTRRRSTKRKTRKNRRQQ
jgi:hypothetical protein